MKVLGVVCSPRTNGNTEAMMEIALAGARCLGAEYEKEVVIKRHYAIL